MIARTAAASKLPAGNAGLWPARPEAAPCGVAMLGSHQHRPAPFSADGEALDQPQDDQRDRSPDTDLCIGREQADEDRRDAHHDQTEHQEALAADAIAEMSKDDPADGPSDEAQRIGREREHRTDERVELGKEQLVEDERGGRAVEEEIVPLDGRADEARHHHAPKRRCRFTRHYSSPLPVIARSGATKQSSSTPLDCFAVRAMTPSCPQTDPSP